MYAVQSLQGAQRENRGTVFVIKCPVTAERSMKALHEAIGPVLLIDGIEYRPKAYEIRLPATPVRIGEKIGVLV